MLRLTVVRLVQAPSFTPVAVRSFATSAPIYNKASKSGRKVRWTSSSPPPPATATSTPGQAGTDVGQGGTGLFEGEAAPATPESVEPEIPTPDQIEREMLEAQKEAHASEDKVGRPNLAGSDVAHGGNPEAAPAPKAADDSVQRFGPEEVVYTAAPTYNPALMLSLCLVMSVFSFSIADFARVGVEQYDEETGEYTNAPAWKRYLLAGGAATIGTSLIVAGVWAPTRNVVKITLREKAGSIRSTPFPQDSLLTLYNPLTPIAQKLLRQKPRSAPLSKIHLLGQLSETPKSYHPRTPGPVVEPKKGALASLFDKYFPPSKPSASRRTKGKYGHSPIVIEGDRFSMSLKTLRADEPFSTRGAWCKDWDAFERALLHVDESKWMSRSRA